MTAELAVGLPAVALLVLALLALAAAGIAQTRCVDAARAGARAAALGEDDATVTGVARRVAGDGVQVATDRRDGWVTVRVTSAVVAVPWGPEPVRVHAESVARSEP